MLLRLAVQARKTKRGDEASGHLDAAVAVAGSDAEKLQAQLLRADVFIDAGRPGDAVDICQRVLTDEQLRPLAVAADDGHRTIRADLYIADRLKSIVQAHGRGVYESYDREAARLLRRGQEEKDTRLLDDLNRTFPVARAVPDALLTLGTLHESARRWSDAAHAYKRLVLIAPDDNWRAQGDLAAGRRVRNARAIRVSQGQLPRAAGAVSRSRAQRIRQCTDGHRAGGNRACAACAMSG